jgi:phage repressor protein C with HTH and peptisase S24 domain
LLEKYAEHGVNLNWLITGSGSPLVRNADVHAIDGQEHIFIPLYNVTAAAGLCGIINGEVVEVEDRFPFKRYWLERKGYRGSRISDLALIRARGESMEPTIYSGEVMLIDLGEHVRIPEAIRNGAIYIVRWGVTQEEISVKRVHLDWPERKAILISDNPLYRPKEVDLTTYDRLQDFILAKVIWVGKENI